MDEKPTNTRESVMFAGGPRWSVFWKTFYSQGCDKYFTLASDSDPVLSSLRHTLVSLLGITREQKILDLPLATLWNRAVDAWEARSKKTEKSDRDVRYTFANDNYRLETLEYMFESEINRFIITAWEKAVFSAQVSHLSHQHLFEAKREMNVLGIRAFTRSMHQLLDKSEGIVQAMVLENNKEGGRNFGVELTEAFEQKPALFPFIIQGLLNKLQGKSTEPVLKIMQLLLAMKRLDQKFKDQLIKMFKDTVVSVRGFPDIALQKGIALMMFEVPREAKELITKIDPNNVELLYFLQKELEKKFADRSYQVKFLREGTFMGLLKAHSPFKEAITLNVRLLEKVNNLERHACMMELEKMPHGNLKRALLACLSAYDPNDPARVVKDLPVHDIREFIANIHAVGSEKAFKMLGENSPAFGMLFAEVKVGEAPTTLVPQEPVPKEPVPKEHEMAEKNYLTPRGASK